MDPCILGLDCIYTTLLSRLLLQFVSLSSIQTMMSHIGAFVAQEHFDMLTGQAATSDRALSFFNVGIMVKCPRLELHSALKDFFPHLISTKVLALKQ